MNKENEKEQLDDAVRSLREKAKERNLPQPQNEVEAWVPKEIPVKRSAWIWRGMVVLLILVVAIEGFLLVRNREEISLLKYQGGPTVEIYPEPVVLEIALPDEELPALPEESPVPLPDGVEEIPFPAPSE